MTGRSGQRWTTTAALLAVLVPAAAAQPDRGMKAEAGDAKAGDAWEDPGLRDLGMVFRYIPDGSFEMGSPPNETKWNADETPHTVTLTRGFLMSETEVTQGQWKAVMGNNPSHFQRCGDGSPGGGQWGDCPVEQVSWYEAVAFANALSKRSGQEACYVVSGDNGREVSFKGLDCGGYRLPTEAEWEYAARAGTTTPFWTGENLTTDQGNYNDASPYAEKNRQKSASVRTLGANPWGLYEIHGNVWEWVWDGYGSYPAEAVEDPTGPAEGSDRVLRGGSWNDQARDCRAANRNYRVPGTRDARFGFRLVRTLP